jgi:tRNA(Ser,Leu) C12 N-acetylase TAN1
VVLWQDAVSCVAEKENVQFTTQKRAQPQGRHQSALSKLPRHRIEVVASATKPDLLRRMATMDWNVIATVYDRRALRRARRFLSRYGEVARTDFHNVLVLQVPNTEAFLAAMAAALEDNAGIFNDISRIMPAHATFSFESIAEFEDKARSIALQWADRLAGTSFHVRLHRRAGDTSAKLRTHTEEVFLDNAILQHQSETEQPGRIRFEDPDYVLDIETVGPRAGMSIWSRDDLRRFPFLHID